VHGGLSLWFLGYPEQAAENAHRAVALAEQITHAPSVAHVLNHGSLYHQLRRDRANSSPACGEVEASRASRRAECYALR
jgi:hypothetical protein